jgi:hypothetical protein
VSFNEVMAELPKLTSEQRDLLRIWLAEQTGEEWMDDGELSSAEKALIEERIAEHERNPAAVRLVALGGTDPKALAAPRRKMAARR